MSLHFINSSRAIEGERERKKKTKEKLNFRGLRNNPTI